MAAYGRGFMLQDPNSKGYYAEASGPIEAGPYTRQQGFWGYNEFCQKMKSEPDQWSIFRVNTVKARFSGKIGHQNFGPPNRDFTLF